MIVDCHFHVDETMLTLQKMIEGMDLKALDMQAVVETLRQVDVYTKDSILPKYGAHLPGGRALIIK
jgi:hypothetical protein